MKLSEQQLAALRAIDAGECRPKAAKQTLRSLWMHGLVADGECRKPRETWATCWKLTLAGKNALRHGRIMLSGRAG
jgi:hypothetical protein